MGYKTIYVNSETGDIELDGQNSIRMCIGNEEQIQTLRHILGTNRFEFFLDRNFGLDIYSILGSKYGDEHIFRAAIMESLAAERRITDVTELSVSWNPATRIIAISIKVIMDGDALSLSEEVGL